MKKYTVKSTALYMLTAPELARIEDTTYRLARLALELDIEQGWYQYAHNACFIAVVFLRRRGILANLPMHEAIERFAGAVSALSPGLQWESNIRAAYSVALHGMRAPYGSRDRRRKAIRCLESGAAGVFIFANAPKTYCFLDDIARPRMSERVCIDRWVMRMFGLPESVPARAYLRIEQAMQRATARLNADLATDYKPHEVQQLCWRLVRDILKLRKGEYIAIRRGRLVVAGSPDSFAFSKRTGTRKRQIARVRGRHVERLALLSA